MQGAGSCSQCVIKMVSEQMPEDVLEQKWLAEVWNTFVKINNETKTN